MVLNSQFHLSQWLRINTSPMSHFAINHSFSDDIVYYHYVCGVHCTMNILHKHTLNSFVVLLINLHNCEPNFIHYSVFTRKNIFIFMWPSMDRYDSPELMFSVHHRLRSNATETTLSQIVCVLCIGLVEHDETLGYVRGFWSN